MKKILVIAAHPDDEVLGCGATMAKRVLSGDMVKVVIAAEGLTSRYQIREQKKIHDELMNLREIAKTANNILGIKDIEFLGFPDNRMDSVDLLDIIKKLEEIIDDYNPEIVYTHFINDLNVDHQLLSKAVVTACRPMQGTSIKKLSFFEIPSSTEWNFDTIGNLFNPNCFFDISKEFELKLKALAMYQSEMRPWPHPRSIQAITMLAGWRGSMVGYEKAEAFSIAYEKE